MRYGKRSIMVIGMGDTIVHAGDLGSDRGELVQHGALADVEVPGRGALDKDLVLERQHLVQDTLVLTGKELESDGLIVGHVRHSTAELYFQQVAGPIRSRCNIQP